MKEHYSKIKHCFNRSSHYYDNNCELQFLVANQLIDLIIKKKKSYDAVIDVGCGTGLITQLLKAKIQSNHFFALDISDKSLMKARDRLDNCVILESSFDNIPLQKSSVDLVFSNMSFQWSDDFANTIAEVTRVLKKNSILAFSLPIQDSFAEIRFAIDALNLPNCFNELVSDQKITSVLKSYKIVDRVSLKCSYSFGSIYSLFKSIKNVGASHVLRNSKQHLSRVDFERLDSYLKEKFPGQKIPLNYFITCCVAIKK